MADQHELNGSKPPGIIRRVGEDPRAAGLSRTATIVLSIAGTIALPLLILAFNRTADAFKSLSDSVQHVEVAMAHQAEKGKALAVRVDMLESTARDLGNASQDHDRRITRIEALESARAGR